MATIIFDFDGTIADSFDYVVDMLSKGRTVAPLTPDERAELHGMSMGAIGRHFGLSWPRIFWRFVRGRRSLREGVRDMKPFAGMPELIKKLHGEGHELFVVSSNSLRNIRAFLHHYELHTYFLETYGGVAFFGKAPILRKLLRSNNLDLKDSVYIGDETRDVLAANSIKMRVVAVSWGFARLSDLEAKKPTAIAHSSDELLSLLEEF